MKRFLPLVAVLLLNSCFDQNECIITSTNLVKVDLATLAGVSQAVSFTTVQQDSAGVNRDEVRHFTSYEKTITGITSLILPLDPAVRKTYYTFITSDLTEYHLALGYSTYTRVISTECGAFLYYDNLHDATDQNDPLHFPITIVTAPKLFVSVTNNLKLLF